MESNETWNIYDYPDEAVDDSDKTITCTAGQEWEILWVWVELTTSATAGDRQLVLDAYESTPDQIACLGRAGVVQAGSLTRYYLFAHAVPDMTAFRDTDYLTVAIPPTFLKGGDYLRLWDNNAVDATHDDMIIQMKYAARAVATRTAV